MNASYKPRPSAAVHDLTTEQANSSSAGLDTKSALDIAEIINDEDATVAPAVRRALPQIAQAIDAVASAIRHGGRLIYVGAGSSGRIAALDASECPPTFNVDPKTVQFVIAGGPKALGAATEYDEDSTEQGERDIAKRRPSRKDVVCGIAASGRTPYTVAALKYAKRQGAVSVAITCNRNSELGKSADIEIVVEVGPEVVAGSTRMKAATAQKMVVNMISTGAMARLGYVYDNLMVNVHLSNEKLLERGIGILCQAANIDRAKAENIIHIAERNIPVALVMLKAGVTKNEAKKRLQASGGNVRGAIENG